MTGATRVNLSMLTLSVTSVLVPAAFHNVIQSTSDSIHPLTDAQEGHDILAISHGASGLPFVLLLQLTTI